MGGGSSHLKRRPPARVLLGRDVEHKAKGSNMTRTLTCLLLGLLIGGATALAAPRIAVDQAYYDYPDTIEGKAVVHTFILSNVGDQDLVISRVGTTCGCTTTTLEKTRLAPGESVSLVVVFDTTHYSGRASKPVTVSSNDPQTPILNMGLRGNVVARAGYQASVGDVLYDASLLIDVRDAASYAAGHLLGAMNIPVAELATRAASLPASALTFVYDQSGSAATFAAAYAALRAGGVASVYGLTGGLDAWQRSYGAILLSTGESAWGAFVDVSGPRSSLSGTLPAQGFQQAVSYVRSNYVVFIDVRSPDAYAAGHLAGAVNLPEAAVGSYVSGLPTDVQVVVYCDDGTAGDRVAAALWPRRMKTQSLLGGLNEWKVQKGSFLLVTSAN